MELKTKYKTINVYHSWLHNKKLPLGGGDRLLWAKWGHVVCTSLVQIPRLWAGMAADRGESCMAAAGADPWNLLGARSYRGSSEA